MTKSERDAIRNLNARLLEWADNAKVAYRAAWRQRGDEEEAARQDGLRYACSEAAIRLRQLFPDVFKEKS